MQRREFLRTVEVSTVATAAGVLAGQSAEAGTRVAAEKPNAFRLGIYLPELGLPLDESLEVARQVGSKHVWFSRITGEPDVASWSDARAAKVAAQVKTHDLDIFLLNAGNPFKKIHLAELDYKTLASHPAFRRDLAALVRSMQIAAHIGVSAVGSFTFAWPGEYTAGKPTWPMRWMTRGGLIAWNYTNTTVNFRHLAERLGSKRLKLMWGPADNLNSGEWDTATAGFQNARPYLHGLHLKDLHVKDGLRLDFEYTPLGEGDVDYMTILKNLRQHRCDAVLSVSTHFLPPGGTRVDAMKINYANLRGMIGKLEAEV